MIKALFSKRFLLTTLLVPLAEGVMIRLGIWQLDRLEERREYNHQVITMRQADPLELEGEDVAVPDPAITPEDLTSWEYRTAVVEGGYDHDHALVIRNQAWENQAGVHVLTPLILEGSSEAVLVDRGWLPLESYQDGTWREYRESARRVRGLIRLPQNTAPWGGQSNPVPRSDEFIEAWHFIDLEAIETGLPYPLQPVYLQALPAGEAQALPYRQQPEFDLSQGPHLGYAIQWFAFAAALGLGYPIFVYRRHEARSEDLSLPL